MHKSANDRVTPQIAHPQLSRMGLDSGSRSQGQPDCCQSLPESGPIQETIAAANRNVARVSQNLAESWLSQIWLDCGDPGCPRIMQHCGQPNSGSRLVTKMEP